MGLTYRVPAGRVRCEIDKIKGSRFIATLAPASTRAEAEDLVAEARAEFPDARHTCSAWRLGPSGEVWRAHDDGEPSGSAGRPILAQLEGKALTDAVLAVTRIFGGTKLGVGGLVRAYSAAAAAALSQAAVREVVLSVPLRVEHPYSCSGAVDGLLAARDLAPREARYGEDVSFLVDLPLDEAEAFAAELGERTAGHARARREPREDGA